MDRKNVDIVLRAKDEASRAINDVQNSVEKLGQGAKQFMGDAVKSGAAVGAAGLAALGAAAFSSVQSFNDSEKATAQLNAVLRSTHGVAGQTTRSALDLASSLEKVTGFSDEAVLGAENMLLTFTNIRGDVFPGATEAALDMAQAFGMDTTSAAMQLGKALNDPLDGLTKLQRIGVTFTDQQRKQVEAMVAAGDTAGAQAVILKELQTEVGGSARAFGDTFAGKLEQFKNQIDNVKETVGLFIVEALEPLMKAASDFVANVDWEYHIEGQIAAINQAKDSFIAFMQPLINFVSANREVIIGFLVNLAKVVAVLAPAFLILAGAAALVSNPFVILAVAIAGLITLWQRLPALAAIITGGLLGLGYAILTVLVPAWIAQAAAAWAAIAPVLAMAAPFILIGAAIALFAYLVVSNWNTIKNAALATVGFLVAQWQAFSAGFMAIITNLVNWFRNFPANIGYIIGLAARFYWDFYTVTIPTVVMGIIGWLGRLPGAAGNVVMGIINWFRQLPGNIAGAVNSMYGAAMGALNNFRGAAMGWANSTVQGILNFFRQLPGQISSIIQGAISNAGNSVKNFLGGLTSGFGRRAVGGPVLSGTPYIVGEKGPELFVPNNSGTIVPNNRMGVAAGAGGGSSETNFYNPVFNLTTAEAVRALFDLTGRDQELASMGLTTRRGA